MYDAIYKKLTNGTNQLCYVTNRFHELKAANIRLNELHEIMKQYEPNNFIPETKHCISSCFYCISIALIILALYFRVDKRCRKRNSLALLPLIIRKEKAKSVIDTDLTIDELEEIPLEDRIRMNRRK